MYVPSSLLHCENCTESAPLILDKDSRGNADQDDGRYDHLRLNRDRHRFHDCNSDFPVHQHAH